MKLRSFPMRFYAVGATLAFVFFVFGADAQTYRIVEIPGAPSFPVSGYMQPQKMNNLGDVIGYADGGSGKQSSFYYQGLTTKDFSLEPNGVAGATLADLNDLGQLVGNGGPVGPYVWTAGVRQDLGFLPPDGPFDPSNRGATNAMAINNSGAVVGWGWVGPGKYQGFVWSAGNFVTLRPIAGPQSSALDVNDSGSVVGWSQSDPSGASQVAVIWDNHNPVNLHTWLGPGFYRSLALGINSNSEVVGIADVDGSRRHAIYWNYNAKTFLDLDNLPGVTIQQVDANSINDDGVIVGETLISDSPFAYRAVRWIDGRIRDLNDLIDAADPLRGLVSLWSAWAINSRGEILVQGYKSGNGNPRSFKLVPVSTNPPSISPNVSGDVGGASWYRGDVSLAWTIDAKGEVTDYTRGCSNSVITVDVFDEVHSCTVMTSGGRGYSQVVIRRDSTLPIATVSSISSPNAAGWHHSAVSVAFTGTDATSGIASCSPNTLVSSEGANQTSPTGTCTDVAGNESAPVSLSGINIDLTPPVVSASRGSAANDAGWYKAPVVLSFTATDALSGIAADACEAPVTVAGEGAGQSATGACHDIAGNVGTITVSAISIDLTAPTAAAVVTPPANDAGWHKTIPTVSFEGSDAISGSGMANCSSPKSPSVDGAGQSLTGTCTDRAGNVSATATATVSLDRVAPTVTISAPLEGVTYGVGAVLPANFACADPLSGVASCAGTVAKATAFDTSTAGTKTFTVTGTDNAGNTRIQTVSYTVAANYDYGLTTDRSAVAFGGQQVLTSSPARVLVLTNSGVSSVGLKSITFSGLDAAMFSRSTSCGALLAAGASCNVSVFLRPSSMGAKSASLVVTTSAGGAKLVPLSGNGLAPPLTLSTAVLAFGGQLQNSLSVAKQVGITNNWSEPVKLTSLTITGSDGANFSRSTTCGAILAPGSFCTASVYFRPSTAGDKNAQLNIASQSATSPQVVALTGTGTFLQVSVSPTSLNFGSQPAGVASAASMVTVTNTGTQLLRLTAVAITGVDATSFSRSTTCGASLAVGASCDVRVFFRPSARGLRSAVLNISATGVVTRSIALAGEGV